MKLGFLGGTFDPVHLGHLVLAETARDQLGLDGVLLVPAGRPWRKADRRITEGHHRLAMLRLAVRDNPAFEVCTVEVERPGASYTVDTLEWLHAERQGSEVSFILGGDALRDLPNWRRPERILELAALAVARRSRQRAGGALTLAGAPAPRVLWLEMPRLDISASEIRQRVRQGRSIRYLVPEAVEAYIRQHALYRR